jgi:hypothetical protein
MKPAFALALCGHALFVLGVIGQLRAAWIVVALIVAIVASSGGKVPRLTGQAWAPVLYFIALLPLALRPPIAFDETLYHLPLVRALAHSGEMMFRATLRYPVFPQLHELLCVPFYLAGGDVAPHLLAAIEVAIAATILYEWSGALAAALFLGSPIIIQLGTITYVECALALFITAGFYCIDRERFAHAGFFLGTACAVKYLGGYFAVAGLILVLVRSRKNAWKFAACCAAAALPTTIWIVINTGNPVFPFLGHNAWTMSLDRPSLEPLRVIWDVVFARERVNHQPPFTPFFLVMAIVVAMRARSTALIALGYLIAFAFLHKDSRYLVPLIPLFAAAAAAQWPNAPKWTVAIAITPGVLYLGYALTQHPQNSEVAALGHADARTVYVCGAEQLKSYARGELLGDVTGPYAYSRIIARDTSTTAANLRRIDATWYLVSKRTCAPPIANGGMDLVYEDASAQLWRVQESSPHLR